MLRHVVLFTWKDEASEAQKQAVRDGLDALPAAIPEIANYTHGDDAGLAEGNFDFAVVGDFDSRDDYVVYAGHEAHLQLIAEKIRPILDTRVAVQYSVD